MKGTDRYHLTDIHCTLGDRVLPVKNISVGGFFVETPTAPNQGSVISLHLSLPGRSDIDAVGTVAWVNPADKPRCPTLPPGFGFKVQRIAFSGKMAILGCLRTAHPATLRSH